MLAMHAAICLNGVDENVLPPSGFELSVSKRSSRQRRLIRSFFEIRVFCPRLLWWNCQAAPLVLDDSPQSASVASRSDSWMWLVWIIVAPAACAFSAARLGAWEI